jgi:hypothetical protein
MAEGGALTNARGMRGERQCTLWRLAQRRARGSAERGRVQARIGPQIFEIMAMIPLRDLFLSGSFCRLCVEASRFC